MTSYSQKKEKIRLGRTYIKTKWKNMGLLHKKLVLERREEKRKTGDKMGPRCNKIFGKIYVEHTIE